MPERMAGLCLCNHGLEHHPRAGACQGGRKRTKDACPCKGFRMRNVPHPTLKQMVQKLLDCAELSQEDLEPKTVELLEKIRVDLASS